MPATESPEDPIISKASALGEIDLIAPNSTAPAIFFFSYKNNTFAVLPAADLPCQRIDILQPESLTMKRFRKLKVSNQHISNFWSLEF